MFSLLTIKIRSVIFSKCQSEREGHCSDLGNLFLSFLATLGNRVWFHFRWHARFCFRLRVTRGKILLDCETGLVNDDRNRDISLQTQCWVILAVPSDEPINKQSHHKKNNCLSSPVRSSQCLLKFNLLRAWPCKSSRNKHNWIRQRRSNTRLLCYLQASQSFLVSFNNVVLTERGNVSMYLRSERGFIWKIGVIK